MAGNQRALTQARMAAEMGIARFGQWLDGLSGDWPSDAAEADSWKDTSELSPQTSHEVKAPSYYQIVSLDAGADDVEWLPGKDNADTVKVRMKGFVNPSGISNDAFVSAEVVATFSKPMGAGAAGGAFTCFFYGTCQVEKKGNADLSGDNYRLPSVFDCQGNHCDASIESGGHAQSEYFPEENSVSIAERDSWVALVDRWVANDVFGCYREYAGIDIDSDVGGRGDSCIMDVTSGDISVTGNTNTSGLIVVRNGASLNFKGTGHHEGLIVVEAGGALAFSAGTPYVYGAIVDLEGDVDQNVVIGDLDISGNIVIRYSKEALDALSDQVGVSMASWCEVVGNNC